MEFNLGESKGPLKEIGNSEQQSGTHLTFLPSETIFSSIEFDFSILEKRLRELAFLNSGVRIDILDERSEEPNNVSLMYEGGINSFVEWLDRSQTSIHENIVSIKGQKNGIELEVSLNWNDGYYENVLCFTNNIPQRDGGAHLAGFRSSLTRAITKYCQENSFSKKNKVSAAAKVANLSWQKAVINSRRGRLNYRTMKQNEEKRNRKLAN